MERTLNHEMFRDIRKKLGLTQETLAHSLGMTRGMIYYYETGKHAIPVIVQLALKYLWLVKSSK